MQLALSIRPLQVSDAPEMSRVLSDPELYTFTGGAPPSEAELARQYEAQTLGRSQDGSELWLNWIVTLGDDAVGYVQATVPTTQGPAEIAWVIGTPWQGRGFATSAVTLMLQELRARGVTDIIAHIHPGHVASQRVAAHVGMEETDSASDGEIRWVGHLGA